MKLHFHRHFRRVAALAIQNHPSQITYILVGLLSWNMNRLLFIWNETNGFNLLLTVFIHINTKKFNGHWKHNRYKLLKWTFKTKPNAIRVMIWWSLGQKMGFIRTFYRDFLCFSAAIAWSLLVRLLQSQRLHWIWSWNSLDIKCTHFIC